MPRYKSAKRSAKQSKSRTSAKSNASSNLQKVENDFLQLPSKLAAQMDKEINSHKKNEARLKNALNKINAKLKKAESKVKTAGTKAKNSPAGKKLLSAANKAYAQVIKTHTGLHKDLQNTSSSLSVMVNKQAKLHALHKYLGQFEKEWTKSTKANKPNPPVKAKKTKLTAVPSSDNNVPVVENPESNVENVSVDEPTELAS